MSKGIFQHQSKNDNPWLNKIGTLKPNLAQTGACSRCSCELGRISNRGVHCPLCRKKVCRNCRLPSQELNLVACLVCYNRIQRKAKSCEYMKEFTRSASEKIKSPPTAVIAAATESLGRSLKYPFRSACFLKQVTDIPAGISNSIPRTCKSPRLVRGFVPPKLSNMEHTHMPRSSESSSSGSLETSPKPPLSPVIKMYQAATEFVDSARSNSSSPLSEQPVKIYRKVSNKLLVSSSSSEDDSESAQPVKSCEQQLSKINLSSNKINYEGCKSSRRLNSAKILSCIANNQATAFQFPPIRHRSSSNEREGQSSEEHSASFGSVNNEDDIETSSPALVPIALPRIRKVSPLRKQQAIVEELCNNEISDGTFTEDPDYTEDSKSERSREKTSSNQNVSLEYTPSLDKSEQDLDQTGCLFKKVTLKKTKKASSLEEDKLNPIFSYKSSSQAQPKSTANANLSKRAKDTNLASYKWWSLSRVNSLDDLKTLPRKFIKLNLPVRGRFRKFIKKSKMIRDQLVICSPRFGKKSKELDSAKLNQAKRFSWADKSASLPNQDYLKHLSKSEVINFKYSSLDGRSWRIGEELEEASTNDQLNFHQTAIDQAKYQLVFMDHSSRLNNSISDIYDDLEVRGSKSTGYYDDHTKTRSRILRVRSHLEISNGTAYIEDSDWEMCSDPGEMVSLLDDNCSHMDHTNDDNENVNYEDVNDYIMSHQYVNEVTKCNEFKTSLQVPSFELMAINLDNEFNSNHESILVNSIPKKSLSLSSASSSSPISKFTQITLINQFLAHTSVDQIISDNKLVPINLFPPIVISIDKGEDNFNYGGDANVEVKCQDSYHISRSNCDNSNKSGNISQPIYFYFNHNWYQINCLTQINQVTSLEAELNDNNDNIKSTTCQINWTNSLLLSLIEVITKNKDDNKMKEDMLSDQGKGVNEDGKQLELNKSGKQICKKFGSQRGLPNLKFDQIKIFDVNKSMNDTKQFGLKQIKFDTKDNFIFYQMLDKALANCNQNQITSFQSLLCLLYNAVFEEHLNQWLNLIELNHARQVMSLTQLMAIYKLSSNINIKSESDQTENFEVHCSTFWSHFVSSLVNIKEELDLKHNQKAVKRASLIVNLDFINNLGTRLEKYANVVFDLEKWTLQGNKVEANESQEWNKICEEKLESVKELNNFKLRKCGTGIVDDEASSTTQILLKQTSEELDCISTNSSHQTRFQSLSKLDFHSSFLYCDQTDFLLSTSALINTTATPDTGTAVASTTPATSTSSSSSSSSGFPQTYPTHQFLKKCNLDYLHQYSSNLISSLLKDVKINLYLNQESNLKYILNDSVPSYSKFDSCPSFASPSDSDMSDLVLGSNEDENNSFNSFNDDLDYMLDDASLSSLEEFCTNDGYYGQSNFGNPLTYSLHTIFEESCEESEPDSIQPVYYSEKSSDYEKFEIGHNVITKEGSSTESEDDDEDVDDKEDNLYDNSELLEDGERLYSAFSKLEKYFTTGLLGSQAFQYPDDVEFLDDNEPSETKLDSIKTNNHKKEPKIEETVILTSSEEPKCNQCKSGLVTVSLVEDDQGSKMSQETDQNDDNSKIKIDKILASFANQNESNATTSLTESKEAANDDNEIKKRCESKKEYRETDQNQLISKFSSNVSSNSVASKSESEIVPPLKALETQIAFLMKVVSPVNVATENDPLSSNTLESNNSDYGSDTLESTDYSSENEKSFKVNLNNHERVCPSSEQGNTESGKSSQSSFSEETIQIYQHLMGSLKKLTQIMKPSEANKSLMSENENDITKVKSYIRNQIINLMHNVQTSSHQESPKRLRKRDRKILTVSAYNSPLSSDNNCDSSDGSEGSCRNRLQSNFKCESESSSETISASVSIPSYDDSDNAPTECELSHEMEELFAMLSDSANKDGSAQFQLNTEDDKASLKSWEARISLFSNRQAENDSSRSKAHFDSSTNKTDFNEENVEDGVNVDVNDNDDDYYTQIDESKSARSITVNGQKLRSDKDKIKFDSNTVKSSESLEHKTIVKIDDHKRTENLSPFFDSLKDRSFSSDSVSSVLTVKPQKVGPKNSSVSELNLEESRSTLKLTIDEEEDSSNLCLQNGRVSNSQALRKIFTAKEKASSENNLHLAKLLSQSNVNIDSSKVTGTKSAGNVSEIEKSLNKKGFRDTGYYSFKSSEESIKSLEENQKCPKSTETILEVEEECEIEKKGSFRGIFKPSSNPTKTCTLAPTSASGLFRKSKTNSFPSFVKNNPVPQTTMPLRTRSSFFSTSGVLRKLLRENKVSPFKSRTKGKMIAGGSKPCSLEDRSKFPHISISDYSQSSKESIASIGSTESDAFSSQVKDLDKDPSHSNRSLSSYGQFRSESMSSVYSGAGGGRYGSIDVSGEILFSITYNTLKSTMEVNIKECRNLSPVDKKRNRSDPYVKLYLLPDHSKTGKRKTKIKKHTLNPVFDEVLKFNVTKEDLDNRTLWISVWHADIFGRNEFLGKLTLPLSNEVLKNSSLTWYSLQERTDLNDPTLIQQGDLFIALKFVTSNISSSSSKITMGKLLALIKEAHNLTPTRSNGTSDPFCKSYLLPNRNKSSKQKTPVIKKTCNPRWNHTFIFEDILLDDLKERCLEVTIWDYDKLTSNDFLGGVRLSLGSGKHEGRDVDWMDSTSDEINLWKQMLERPNMWVYGELHLRPTLQGRHSF